MAIEHILPLTFMHACGHARSTNALRQRTITGPSSVRFKGIRLQKQRKPIRIVSRRVRNVILGLCCERFCSLG